MDFCASMLSAPCGPRCSVSPMAMELTANKKETVIARKKLELTDLYRGMIEASLYRWL